MDITVTPLENCDLVGVKGRIDSYTSPSLSEALKNLINQSRFKILLDMNEVNYVSSAGLRVLIDTQKNCKKSAEGELILVNTPTRVYETLELAGFAPLFKFYNDVKEASEAF